MSKDNISRRRFIRHTSIAAIGGSLTLACRDSSSYDGKTRSRVVLIRDESVMDDNGVPRLEAVQNMLDEGVKRLTGKADPQAAWLSMIGPKDIVGLKNNRWPYLRTTPQVEEAIRRRVLQTGVTAANFAVDDLGVLRNPVFQKATALINARPMRAHHWSGVGSLIKNYIMFLPNPASIHPDSCADLGRVWTLPIVKGKTRLNVLVMFTPQFHVTGPHSFNPRYLHRYDGLLLGFDPVAVDTMGLRIIEGMRREHFGDDRPLSPPAKHIVVADQKYRLGTSNPDNIELIRIGYDRNSFI
ncbi:MAG TPA: hypothetical protein VLL97_10980 [Acidobacteriota bacterium]|nr:hypothetical protein [Acidobacteriota bacterium]